MKRWVAPIDGRLSIGAGAARFNVRGNARHWPAIQSRARLQQTLKRALRAPIDKRPSIGATHHFVLRKSIISWSLHQFKSSKNDLKPPLFDIGKPVFDIKTSRFDIKNSFLDIKKPFLEIKKQFLDIKNSFPDIKKQFLDIKNPLRDIKNSLHDIKNQRLNINDARFKLELKRLDSTSSAH